MTDELSPPSYQDARERGEVIEQGSYHQPGKSMPYCGCSLDTEKGAYRDVTIEMPDGRVVHFYHQSPVVVEKDGTYRLDNHGYETRTTKQRINSYLPRGYKIVQRDYEWLLKTWDPDADFGDREYEDGPFENGMVIEG